MRRISCLWLAATSVAALLLLAPPAGAHRSARSRCGDQFVPAFVGGRQLDGPGELQFDQGPNWTNKLHRELRLVGPYGLLNPAATFLRAPGCYAYRVDGRGFTYQIVFAAIASS